MVPDPTSFNTNTTMELKIKHQAFIVSYEQFVVQEFVDVNIIFCDFDQRYFELDFFKLFSIHLPQNIRCAVGKRQSEYLAGRVAAHIALFQFVESPFQIYTGEHRNPIWPESIVGSITHASNRAFAAVAMNGLVEYLGIDYEEILSSKTINEIATSIVNEYEMDIINGSSLKFEQAFTIAFSAKESLFKALYPYVKEYFDFDAVELQELCVVKQLFSFILLKNLSSDFPKGKKVFGKYFMIDNNVFTVIYNRK